MLVSEMTDSHLDNAIAMIERGHDAKGRVVTQRTGKLYYALIVQREIRDLKRYQNPLWG
jgi:hypothetical protein